MGRVAFVMGDWLHAALVTPRSPHGALVEIGVAAGLTDFKKQRVRHESANKQKSHPPLGPTCLSRAGTQGRPNGFLDR